MAGTKSCAVLVTSSMCRWAVAGALGGAVLLAAASGRAQPLDSRVHCKPNSSGPPDMMIQICNETINLGHEVGASLAGAYIARGRAYYSKSEFDRAIADFSEALKNDPGNVLALRHRGLAHFALQNYDRAIADDTDAIWRARDNIQLLQDRAKAYEKMGRYDLAIADYSEAIKLKPRSPGIFLDRCYARIISNRELPLALDDCNEALRFLPRDPTARERRGLVQLRLGHIDLAMMDFDAVLAVNSGRATALYGRGVAKLRKFDRAGSAADINAARLIRPDIVDEFIRAGIQ